MIIYETRSSWELQAAVGVTHSCQDHVALEGDWASGMICAVASRYIDGERDVAPRTNLASVVSLRWVCPAPVRDRVATMCYALSTKSCASLLVGMPKENQNSPEFRFLLSLFLIQEHDYNNRIVRPMNVGVHSDKPSMRSLLSY